MTAIELVDSFKDAERYRFMVAAANNPTGPESKALNSLEDMLNDDTKPLNGDLLTQGIDRAMKIVKEQSNETSN